MELISKTVGHGCNVERYGSNGKTATLVVYTSGTHECHFDVINAKGDCRKGINTRALAMTIAQEMAA